MVVVQQSVRDYPQPYGINAAHLLGYLSPITKDELDAAGSAATPRSTVLRSSAGPASRRSTTRGCAGSPATSG